MEPPTKNPEVFIEHDSAEPDRDGVSSAEQKIVTDEDPSPVGAKLSVEFNGLKAEAVGRNLAECRVYLLDVVVFLHNTLKQESKDGGYR